MHYVRRPKPISVKGLQYRAPKLDEHGEPKKDEGGQIIREDKPFELSFESYLLNMLFTDAAWSEGSNAAAKASLELKHAIEDKVEELEEEWEWLSLTDDEWEELSKRARASKARFSDALEPLNRKLSRFHYVIAAAITKDPRKVEKADTDDKTDGAAKEVAA